MLLAAQAIGLGGFISGFGSYYHKVFEMYLKVPKGYRVITVTAFGVPKNRYEREVIYTDMKIN